MKTRFIVTWTEIHKLYLGADSKKQAIANAKRDKSIYSGEVENKEDYVAEIITPQKRSHFLLEQEADCQNCGEPFIAHYTKELKIGLCNKCMTEPFEVVSVARADLENIINSEDIAKLTDGDMEGLARVIQGALNGVDSRVFWDALEIAVKVALHDKKLKERE